VSPVTSNGIMYSASGNGRAGYVVATDVATGKELWRQRIFKTHIRRKLEEDVQWIFISHLAVDGGNLLVRDEKSRCYTLDLGKHHVRKAACAIEPE